jgi:Ca2+-binding RTX toxin-like protein
MARVTLNPSTSTISFGDVATLTIGSATIVTANATTLAVRVTVSGTINGTLDVVYGGAFQTLAGVPIGGEFTSLRVDFNQQTLLNITDFSLPFSATQAPDFSNLMAQILTGNDVLTGGALGEVINGFAGVDNIDGGDGIDIINGNQGNDSLIGGNGADVLRGGKDDDTIIAGAGNDFVSGDRGNDTVSGGAGADTFHTFSGAGVDRVTDFSRAEGDRVAVLTGSTYTVSQVGADVVIDLGGGTQMVLVNVQQSSLTGDWIFNV